MYKEDLAKYQEYKSKLNMNKKDWYSSRESQYLEYNLNSLKKELSEETVNEK